MILDNKTRDLGLITPISAYYKTTDETPLLATFEGNMFYSFIRIRIMMHRIKSSTVEEGVGISLRMKMRNLKLQIKTCINEGAFNGAVV